MSATDIDTKNTLVRMNTKRFFIENVKFSCKFNLGKLVNSFNGL